MQIGIGLSSAKDHILAAKEAVNAARAAILAERVDLAIVFSTIEFAHPSVIKTIRAAVGAVPLVGCSSLALLTNEGIHKHGILVILCTLPSDAFFNVAVVRKISAKSAHAAGGELGEQLLYGCQGIRRDISIFFSDGLLKDSAGLLSGLEEKLGKSFPLVGASASDNLTRQKTLLFFNDEILSDAACGILWGGKLNFGVGMAHGWKPLGKPRIATKSFGNVLGEIDSLPAAQIYEEYLNQDFASIKKNLRHISVLYPIGVHLADEEEYLLRNITDVTDRGELILQGNVPQGSTLRLMIGTKESCLASVEQAVNKAKLELLNRSIRFALVFDSVSRYSLLGRAARKELTLIKEGLDNNIPFAGIYTYGEQAPLKAMQYLGKTYFHNQTITFIAFGG